MKIREVIIIKIRLLWYTKTVSYDCRNICSMMILIIKYHFNLNECVIYFFLFTELNGRLWLSLIVWWSLVAQKVIPEIFYMECVHCMSWVRDRDRIFSHICLVDSFVAYDTAPYIVLRIIRFDTSTTHNKIQEAVICQLDSR